MNLQSTVVFDQIDSRNIIGTRSLPKHNQSNVSSESILSLGRGERSEQVAADDKTTAELKNSEELVEFLSTDDGSRER